MRFYDVDGGAVRVDGHDVRDLTRESLRSGWGMVLQDTWVRRATVRENVSMGRPDATLEEVRAACREAYADDFICRLPQGYDTVLDGSTSLSAGQRQLLCIARVMLARPAMLILDEATSNIDTRTELLVQRALARLMEGRTSFVVAHRLSTVRDADLICVIADGRIAERGTHEALLARGRALSAHLRARSSRRRPVAAAPRPSPRALVGAAGRGWTFQPRRTSIRGPRRYAGYAGYAGYAPTARARAGARRSPSA